MTSIEYTCRFCKTKRTFECDLFDYRIAGVKVNLATWLENISCNRCAEFNKSQQRIRNRISATAYYLIKAREAGSKSLPDIESACRVKLDRLARDLNTLVAAHYFREDLYDDQFGEALYQRPDKVNACLTIQTSAILGGPEPVAA